MLPRLQVSCCLQSVCTLKDTCYSIRDILQAAKDLLEEATEATITKTATKMSKPESCRSLMWHYSSYLRPTKDVPSPYSNLRELCINVIAKIATKSDPNNPGSSRENKFPGTETMVFVCGRRSTEEQRLGSLDIIGMYTIGKDKLEVRGADDDPHDVPLR